ncbi:hypothetical protein [Roseovarius sp. D0-M9]|uniref:hypothetical protein n=1 Tax=Roseovarius sp. D0-M9 TaxID=3127117 RepID=UPI00300FFD0A
MSAARTITPAANERFLPVLSGRRIWANPIGEGVWQGGGVGFRWEDGIPMRN